MPDFEEEEAFFELLLKNPNHLHHGFKLINVYLCRYSPSDDQLRRLEEAGCFIDPHICVRNYRHNLVEYLIREGRLNPNDHIHDICLTPYHRDRPEDFLLTLKLLIDYGADIDGLDSQDRSPLECLQSNRPLRWIGEPYIRKIIKQREKARKEINNKKINRYLVD